MRQQKEPLTQEEVRNLTSAFPELSWMKAKDWQSVAAFTDLRTRIDEAAIQETPRPEAWPDYAGVLPRLLQIRAWRVEIRKDCRSYFGEANVDNINDPTDPTWA